MNYYVQQKGKTKGPYTFDQIKSLSAKGALSRDALYCKEGEDQWRPLIILTDQFEENRDIETSGEHKAWKALLKFSALTALAGLLLMLAQNEPWGARLLVIGCIGAVASAVVAWWNHG